MAISRRVDHRGFVYRGSKHPTIAGEYVFGISSAGDCFTSSGATSASSTLLVTTGYASGIATRLREDVKRRKIYVIDYSGGGLYELAVTP